MKGRRCIYSFIDCAREAGLRVKDRREGSEIIFQAFLKTTRNKDSESGQRGQQGRGNNKDLLKEKRGRGGRRDEDTVGKGSEGEERGSLPYSISLTSQR